MIVRKVQAVDNISAECEPGDRGDRGGIDDQIAEPQAEAGLRRKGRGEPLGALLLVHNEVAQNVFVIGKGLIVEAAAKQPAANSEKSECCNDKPAKSEKSGCCC